MAAALRNPARDRLEKGELSLGIGLRQTRTVDIAPAMKACGYDWLFIDLEHNSMDLDIVAAYRTGTDACRANGKWAGLGGINDEALIRRYVEMGVRMVLGGSDLGFLMSAASERAKALRGLV